VGRAVICLVAERSFEVIPSQSRSPSQAIKFWNILVALRQMGRRRKNN